MATFIIGIDPGSTSTGLTIMNSENNNLTLARIQMTRCTIKEINTTKMTQAIVTTLNNSIDSSLANEVYLCIEQMYFSPNFSKAFTSLNELCGAIKYGVESNFKVTRIERVTSTSARAQLGIIAKRKEHKEASIAYVKSKLANYNVIPLNAELPDLKRVVLRGKRYKLRISNILQQDIADSFLFAIIMRNIYEECNSGIKI